MIRWSIHVSFIVWFNWIESIIRLDYLKSVILKKIVQFDIKIELSLGRKGGRRKKGKDEGEREGVNAEKQIDKDSLDVN